MYSLWVFRVAAWWLVGARLVAVVEVFFLFSFSLLVKGLANVNRYNTFFVLYPIGISSECLFMYLALDHAEKYVHEYYKWFLVLVLGIYVPGSYILYTHMMAQRRRVMRGKSRVD